GLGALAAVVALLVLYFGKCLPGLGIGGSSSPAPEAPTPPAESKAGGTEDALQLTVDGERCRRDGETPAACADLCESLAGEAKERPIRVNGTLGTHAAVDALRRCLADRGFRDVVVRTE
ncbi:MAG TPA: hypothetical protein VFG69_09940, partial [Nannocystaceae bacterium]|nr:hypothetical protein [Nannocystaceae bacterium]